MLLDFLDLEGKIIVFIFTEIGLNKQCSLGTESILLSVHLEDKESRKIRSLLWLI